MRFVISSHACTEGVRMSKPGHFTNLPFGSDAEAVAHAQAIAGKADVTIERERYRAVRAVAT
jgi:hypothetical protein